MKKLLLLFIIGTHLFAQSEILKLEDAISIAKTNNPDIKISDSISKGKKAIITQSESSYLPHISANAGVVYGDNDKSSSDLYQTAGLGASQLIYDFGKTTSGIDSSKDRHDSSKADINATINNIVFQVTNNFYTTLQKHHLITVANEGVALNEKQLYQAKEYFKAGVRTKIDVTNAQLELSHSQLSLIDAKNALILARVDLEQTMGMIPNGGDYALFQESSGIDELYDSITEVQKTLDELKLLAMKNRNEIKSMELNIAATKHDEKSIDAEYLPTINAQADYTYANSSLPTVFSQWNAGVYLNWEFFSGYQTDGKKEQTKSAILEQLANLQKLKLNITNEVTTAYQTTISQRKSIDIQAASIKLSKENLQLAQERYKAGLGDMIELNNAQAKYITAKSDFVTTYYSYLISIARLKQATNQEEL